MNHYSNIKYTDRIYTVCEKYGNDDDGSTLGFILGDKKAMIIDTGMGVTGNLRKYLEEITELPIACFITHPHPDHAGSANLFDERYMNPIDNSMIEWALTKEKRRGQMVKFFDEMPELEQEINSEINDALPFTYIPVNSGDVLDLGGITLQALLVPGHTAGSTVMFCPEENYLFAGDAVAPMTSLIGEGPEDYVSVKDYLHGLENLAEIIDTQTKIICGHVPYPLSEQLVYDMIDACKKVISGNASKEETVLFPFLQEKEKGREYYQERYGTVRLIYDVASL